MSGYLLSPPFVRAFVRTSQRRPSAKLFLLRRVLRIVPLYVVAVFFSAFVDVAFRLERVTFKGVVAHLFMLQDFTPKFALSLNGPLWTMPVDFEFYLALPIAAAIAFRTCAGIAPDRRPTALAAILIAVSFSSVAYRIGVQHVSGSLSMTVAYFILMSNLFGMAFVFCCGIALAYVAERHGLPQLGGVAATGTLALAIALFAAASQTMWLPLALDTVLAALSVVALLVALPSFAFARRIAESRVVTRAAALAYAVYLFHLPIMRVVSTRLVRPTGTVAFFELTILSSIVLLPIVVVAHRSVEKPFLRIKDRKREAPV